MKISNMSKICIIIAYIFIIAGCSRHSNKIYDYKPIDHNLDFGKFGAKLIGTFVSAENETIKGSPYKLFMWFELDKESNSSVTIEKVELYNPQTKKIVFHRKDRIKKQAEEKSDGVRNIYFEFKNLNLEYYSYVLILNLKLEMDTSIIRNQVKLRFEKNYKEYRTNIFWERLMSV